MATCRHCGHHLESEDHFCAGCGLPADPDTSGTATTIIPIVGESGPITAIGSPQHLTPGSAMLVVRRGAGEGSEFLLPSDADIIRIGRAPEAEIFLDDVTVSRHHAELRQGAEGWAIRDAGSLNGTYVNRKRVDDQQLHGGDEVQIGKFRFSFLAGS